MEQQSPLQKYKRAPKLYVDLPSKGNWYPRGCLDKAEEVEIYSMTANDELAVRTPDALFTGQAVKKLIENCIPSIHDAWMIPSIDIDYILAAIRIASYGDVMTVSMDCAKCGEKNDYGIELQKIMDHSSSQEFQYELRVDDFVIRIRPFTYKELTEIQKRTIILQRQIVQNIDKEVDDEHLSKVYQEINQIATDAVCSIVTEIITPEGESEKQPIFIKEFLTTGDNRIFNEVKALQENNVSKLKIPDMNVVCGHCEKESTVKIDLDYSNFFVRR